jgi:hypothetical protein
VSPTSATTSDKANQQAQAHGQHPMVATSRLAVDSPLFFSRTRPMGLLLSSSSITRQLDKIDFVLATAAFGWQEGSLSFSFCLAMLIEC